MAFGHVLYVHEDEVVYRGESVCMCVIVRLYIEDMAGDIAGDNEVDWEILMIRIRPRQEENKSTKVERGKWTNRTIRR